MADEENAGNVESSKTVNSALDRSAMLDPAVTTREERLEKEVGILLRSPNDNSQLLNDDPKIYQAGIVENPQEGETTTTETTAVPSSVEGGADDTAASESTDTPESSDAAESSDVEQEVAAATTDQPTAQDEENAEDNAPAPSGNEKAPAKLAEAAAEVKAIKKEGASPDVSEEVLGDQQSKDPYAIEIPLDKKVNKRTQRKLWEEIEKRKPLIPKHVVQHIKKYAKPPFETWGCKFKSKGSCFGCSK